MHGGFQTLLLDETMSWTAHGICGLNAFVTKELQVHFLHPVDVHQQLTAIGYIEDDDGKKMMTRGELRDNQNRLLTTATATLVRVDPSLLKPKKQPNE